jgi:hypothetical protein
MDDDPALVDPASRDDSAAAVDQRMARLLRTALGTLESHERAAVLRRYGDRHTLAEVACELGTTEKAVQLLIFRRSHLGLGLRAQPTMTCWAGSHGQTWACRRPRTWRACWPSWPV